MTSRTKNPSPRTEPGISKLITRVVQALGIFVGVLTTVWCFLFLLGKSFEYGEVLLIGPVAIPVVALALFLWLYRRRSSALLLRWFLLEFFTASLVTWLLMRFVVVNLI